MSNEAYDRLAPVQWPVGRNGRGRRRLFSDGAFFTPAGRARFIPVAAGRLAAAPSRDFPFVLNTGRVRDHWHTMTRTGLSARLSAHIAEPFVEMHPWDFERIGLEQGALARVETSTGSAELRVLVNEGQKPGTLFVPIHWSAENSSTARAGALVHGITDPISGQPDAKGTPARVSPVAATYYGFVLSRDAVAPSGFRYWARARTSFGFLTNFALDPPVRGWHAWSSDLLPPGECLSFEDDRSGLYRVAVLSGGRLEAVLYVGLTPVLPSLEWLKRQFAEPNIPAGERRGLLAGRPVSGKEDEGPIVCVCLQTGKVRIEAAVARGAHSLEALRTALGAGTNCGSCIPELRRLLAASGVVQVETR